MATGLYIYTHYRIAQKTKAVATAFNLNRLSCLQIADESGSCFNQHDLFARLKLRKTNLIIALSLVLYGTAVCCSSEIKAYDYVVRAGDTLSEITLMYTGTHDYGKIAWQNRIPDPNLIYPGDLLTLPSSRPIETLRAYLSAVYKSEAMEAYKLLSVHTRSNISFDEFKKALDEITFYNLSTIFICADFIVNENHVLQLKIRLNEDPASWGFSLIREKYKWYILLFDLNPTNPQDDGFAKWRCD